MLELYVVFGRVTSILLRNAQRHGFIQGYNSPHNLPRRRREGVEIHVYSFFNLRPSEGGCYNSLPRRFTPGHKRRPSCRRLGGPQGRSGRVRKISPSLKLDPRTVQAVGSHYIDRTILAHKRARWIHVTVSWITSSTKRTHRPKRKFNIFIGNGVLTILYPTTLSTRRFTWKC